MLLIPESVISIENVTLEHLLEGSSIPIGVGKLELSIPPPPPPSYDETTSASTPTTPIILLTLLLPGSVKPTFDLTITPTSAITQISNTYLVSISGDEMGFARITLPKDLPILERETFESVLTSLMPSVNIQKSEIRGKLVLIDEESNVVVGELLDVEMDESNELNLEDMKVDQEQIENESIVVVDLDSKNGKARVRPWLQTPFVATSNPTSSKIITLGDYVSRGIIASADVLAKTLEMGSNTFVENTKETNKPLIFSASTMRNVHAGNSLTGSGRAVSGKAISMIGNAAASVGGVIGSTLGIQAKPNGVPPTGFKGVVHNTLISVSSITDSLETGGRVLIDAGTNASALAIGHKYGSDAATVTRKVGSSVKHVALVYIDARGITRKALLKSVGVGAVRAKMVDGREVILSEENMVVEEESDIDLVGRGTTEVSTKGTKAA